MSKTIQIGFLNFWNGAQPFTQEHFIFPLESKNIKCIIVDPTKEKSDIVIVSCFGKYSPENVIGDPVLVWYTGENESNNQLNKNVCHYTLTFNPDSKTNLQYPLWALSYRNLQHKKYNEHTQKTKFCTFIISNLNAKFRISIFNYISQNYKRIDSIGDGLNNTGYVLPRRTFEYPANYKFNLCFENSQDNYYITEKIINAYAYNTVPVYWGGNNVEEFFNPKSFINCNGLSEEEILQTIKEIDNNDKLYNEMLNSYPFNEKIDYYEYYHNKLVEFVLSII